MACQFPSVRRRIVQFVIDNLLLRIVETLPLCLFNISHEIQLVFTIKNICTAVVAQQFTYLDTWCIYFIWSPMVRTWNSGTTFGKRKSWFPCCTALLQDFYGQLHVSGKFFQKHPNSDKVTGSILENQPKIGQSPASWNKKTISLLLKKEA